MGEVIQSLTDDIFAEQGKGAGADQAELTRLYKTRDEIARAEHPEGEEPPPAELADQGPSYADLQDDILRLGEAGELVLQAWNGDETRLGRALALIDSSPELTASFAAASRDPQLQADLLLIAEKNAREAGMAPLELSQAPREPSPSPTNCLAWQSRLNEIYADYPVGSREYNSAEVQLEVRLLHERIHGNGGIVGVGGRTV